MLSPPPSLQTWFSMPSFRFTIIFLTSLLSITDSIGQDTFRVEPSFHYSRVEEQLQGKNFAFSVKYAREDIVYHDNRKRIEYCYYLDNERHCFGQDYSISNDSTLHIDGHAWQYEKRGTQYFLERYDHATYECGMAVSLIPMVSAGLFSTYTLDKLDVLWTTDYSSDNPAKPYDSPSWGFPKSKVKEKIYKPSKVDELPTLSDGSPLDTIFLPRTDGCYGEPNYFVDQLNFTVTKTGRIVNIEQGVGNLDIQTCPYYMMDLIKHLLQKCPLKPATRHGQAVHVQWSVHVVMP